MSVLRRVLLLQPLEGARWRSITAYAGSLAMMLREAGLEVDVAEAPWFNPPSVASGMRRRWSGIEAVRAGVRGEYDVVHLTDHALGHHARRFREHAAVVTTCHDLMQVTLPGYYATRRERWLKRGFLRRPIGRLPDSDLVLAVSGFTRDALKERFGAAVETAVVPNVVRPAFRLLGRAEAEADLADAGVALPAGLRVLSVGNDRAYKNLEALMEAMARPALAHASLVRVGPLTSRQRALGDSLGVARRTAVISAHDDETLARVYAASDVLAQPSLGEGFGIPVIEAMACGLPVVISDGGALPEVAGGAARVVSLAEVDFSGALAQELARAAGQRDELGAAGVARAAVFRPAVVVNALLEAYQQALQRSSNRR